MSIGSKMEGTDRTEACEQAPLRDTFKKMSRKLNRLKDIGQHESRIMRTGKSEFNLIGADSLTIEMQGTSGTRGNFNTVPALNVPCSVWFRASGQGVPEDPDFWRCLTLEYTRNTE